jgi:hypothetical protein
VRADIEGVMSKKEITAGIVLMAVGWILALLSSLVATRPAGEAVCALDSVSLKPEFQVDVTFRDGSKQSFCNAACTLSYLREGRRAVRSITVRDENSGEPLDAKEAFYAKSEVFTHRESSNKIHIFAALDDAKEHAEQYGGRMIPNPFSAYH